MIKPTKKRAGVLLHVSSLPSGTMGQDAYQFVDFLKATGASIWQTLPLNQTHGDGSPYQALSAHAGNIGFIDLPLLAKAGWISKADALSDTKKSELMAKAHAKFIKAASPKQLQQFKHFCKIQSHWLDDYALFVLLRRMFGQTSWISWPQDYKDRDTKALNAYAKGFAEEIAAVKFTQFIFFEQWLNLKEYARENGVLLFGDIPIFVGYDSADVWTQPDMFKLDAEKHMTVVAGVPPDYFSATGQRWGNPHYDWLRMQSDGFSWWKARIATQALLFDIVRIDHFRGLQAAWEIPANEETAINGTWVEAPGDALLEALSEAFPEVLMVAEDLGVITEEVTALRLKYNLPGMRILQFGFGGGTDNPHMPDNIDENSVAYTGTHDNDTTLGWYHALDDHTRHTLHQYLGDFEPTMPGALISLAMESAANTVMIPMQDILRLGTEARMNVPGTTEGNWQWRFDWTQLEARFIANLQGWIIKSNRRVH